MGTFHSDGYQDFMWGEKFSPPDLPVLAEEYREGWNEAKKALELKAEAVDYQTRGYGL